MLIELPYSLPGKIFRSPMPFSRFDKQDVWPSFLEEEIDLVVVLTEQQEYLVYAGKDLPAFYRSHGMEALHIPVPDFGIPDDLESWQEGLESSSFSCEEWEKCCCSLPGGHWENRYFPGLPCQGILGSGSWNAIHWVRDSVPGAMENCDRKIL